MPMALCILCWQAEQICSVAAPPATQARTTDTELWLGLHVLSQQCQGSVVVIPAAFAIALVQLSCEDALSQLPALPPIKADGCLVAPLLHQGHWTLLTLHGGESGVQAICHDGIQGRNAGKALDLAKALCTLMRLPLIGFVEVCLETARPGHLWSLRAGPLRSVPAARCGKFSNQSDLGEAVLAEPSSRARLSEWHRRRFQRPNQCVAGLADFETCTQGVGFKERPGSMSETWSG